MNSNLHRPEPAEVVAVVLDGLSAGGDLEDLCDTVRAWHGPGSTFPADVLMELAADAFIAVGATRADRLQIEGLADRLLPEWPARGNVGHQKRRHGVYAAVLIAAGAEPEDTSWWSVDDLWFHALLAVVVFVRAAAERRHMSIADVCEDLRTTRT